MSDDRYDEELDDETESPGDLRKQLDAAKKAAKQAEARAATLERNAAFRDAGIDLSTKLGQMFSKAYDGDLSADAIKAEAEDAGILGKEDSKIPADEIAAQATATEISSGADAPGAGDKEAEALAELGNATSQEEALAIAAKYGVRIKSPLDD